MLKKKTVVRDMYLLKCLGNTAVNYSPNLSVGHNGMESSLISGLKLSSLL